MDYIPATANDRVTRFVSINRAVVDLHGHEVCLARARELAPEPDGWDHWETTASWHDVVYTFVKREE